MRRITVLVLACVFALLVSPAAMASNDQPIGGAGWDRKWHNKPMYAGGNPTNDYYKLCRARMTGPWPSKSNVNVSVGKARLECISKDDMRGTEFIAKLRNQDGGYGRSVHKICDWYSNPNIKYTTRIDANGVKWWGCNATLTVKDRAPGRSQDWYFNVWASDNAWGAKTTTNFQDIVSYCHDHRTWCRKHSGKVAISWALL